MYSIAHIDFIEGGLELARIVACVFATKFNCPVKEYLMKGA